MCKVHGVQCVPNVCVELSTMNDLVFPFLTPVFILT